MSTNPPEDRSQAYVDAAIDVLKALKEVSEVIPLISGPLKATCGVIVSILEMVKTCKKNTKDWDELAQVIKEKSELIVEALKQSDGSSGLQKSVTKQALKYKVKLDEISDDISAQVGDNSKRPRNLKTLWHKMAQGLRNAAIRSITVEKIALYKAQLQNLTIDSIHQAILVTSKAVEEISEIQIDILIQGLKTAPMASGDLHQRCMQGTRTSIINEIREWTSDDAAPQIFWLADAAGTGKSTVAKEITQEWGSKDQLAGRFFFSRDAAETRTSTFFFSTIAQQGLCRLNPEVQTQLALGIRKLKDPTSSTLEEQCTELFFKPLGEMKQPAILVVDAFDECDPTTSNILLPLLLGSLANLPLLKLLIISRPEARFDSSLGRSRHLKQSFSSDAAQNHGDVEAYLRHKLLDVLDEGQIRALIERADGLFIWAATACKIIIDSIMEPEEIMELLMGPGFNDMNALYATALEAAFTSHERKVALLILEAIVAAFEPLSPSSLDKILWRTTSHRFVRKMASILRCEGYDHPIRFLHPTFREYLLHKEANSEYWVDESLAHRSLAKGCLELMARDLHYNMCNLAGFQRIHEKEEDLKVRLAEYMSAALIYACFFWILHFQRVLENPRLQNDTLLTNAAVNFFSSKLLDWLCIAIIPNGIHAIGERMCEMRCYGMNSVLLNWNQECCRILRCYGQYGRVSPLILYATVLAFSPQNALISTTHSKELDFPRPLILTQSLVRNPFPHSLYLSFCAGKKVLSSCGKWLAASGKQRGILYNLTVGVLIPWKHCDHQSCPIKHLSFIGEPPVLLSACNAGLIRWWDLSCTNLPMASSREFQIDFGIFSRHLKFGRWSANGEKVVCVATLKDGGMGLVGEGTYILNVFTNEVAPIPLMGIDSFWNVAFSNPEGDYLLSVHFTGGKLWKSSTGRCLKVYEPNTRCHKFSPDGKAVTFISGCHVQLDEISGDQVNTRWEIDLDGSCNLSCWQDRGITFVTQNSLTTLDTGDGRIVQEWQCGDILSRGGNFHISRDGGWLEALTLNEVLVCGPLSEPLPRFCTGYDHSFIEYHEYEGDEVIIDSSNLIIDSCVNDHHIIDIWPIGEQLSSYPLHNPDSITCMAFSHDGLLLAAGSGGGVISLWDVCKGACQISYQARNSSIKGLEFSKDSSTLMAISYRDITVHDIPSHTIIWEEPFTDGKTSPVAALFPQTKAVAYVHEQDDILYIHNINQQENSRALELSLVKILVQKKGPLSRAWDRSLQVAVSPDENVVAVGIKLERDFHVFCLELHTGNISFCAQRSLNILDERIQLSLIHAGNLHVVVYVSGYKSSWICSWNTEETPSSNNPKVIQGFIPISSSSCNTPFNDGNSIPLKTEDYFGSQSESWRKEKTDPISWNYSTGNHSVLKEGNLDSHSLFMRRINKQYHVSNGNAILFIIPEYNHPRFVYLSDPSIWCTHGRYIAWALKRGGIMIVDCSLMTPKARKLMAENRERQQQASSSKRKGPLDSNAEGSALVYEDRGEGPNRKRIR